jgi:hypothetical protein
MNRIAQSLTDLGAAVYAHNRIANAESRATLEATKSLAMNYVRQHGRLPLQTELFRRVAADLGVSTWDLELACDDLALQGDRPCTVDGAHLYLVPAAAEVRQ